MRTLRALGKYIQEPGMGGSEILSYIAQIRKQGYPSTKRYWQFGGT
jgi:hypothetical protein